MNESLRPSQHMLDTLEKMTLNNQKLHMQRLGLTKPAGNLTTEQQEVITTLEAAMMPDPILKTLGEMTESVLQNGKSPEQESLKKSSGEKFNYTIEDKRNFTIALVRIFQMLNEYGKQGQDFDVIVEGFLFYLARKKYPMKQVIEALFVHLEKSNSIPKPADIENIINPPPPKIDWPYYISLKKKIRDGNYYLDRDEKQFLRNCEDLAILRQRGEMQNYGDAQRQLESHIKQLDYESD